MNKTRAELHIK